MTATAIYDFIVVGAGTAGCALASRLSEDVTKSVLLLEAGGATPPSASAVPQLWPTMIGGSSDWGNWTTVQSANGLAERMVRGRGIGGSSAMNGMMFVRAHRTSYASWEQVGAKGWGFDDLLPYFMRSETAAGGDPGLRGHEGPMRVAEIDPLHPIAAASLDAAVECGYRRAVDIGGGLEIGFGPTLNTIVGGKRLSAADAYLAPALHRSNLKVVSDAMVHRIRLQNGRCTGVEYTVAERKSTVIAESGEVVLTAGAIGSPQLLMLSGVGPQGHLREAGVPVKLDLAGVGANLQNHVLAPVVYSAAREIPPSLGGHAEVIGLIRTECASEGPDIQILVINSTGIGLPGDDGAVAGYTIAAALMRPFSHGVVRLSGPHADDLPTIDPQYFSDDRDLHTLVTGLRRVRQLGHASAFDQWRCAEAAPGPDVEDEQALCEFAKNAFQSYFHAVGTCAMGATDMSVVDSQLRVHGVSGLRVADASIMPSVPSANTAATVYAIGERAAELITDG